MSTPNTDVVWTLTAGKDTLQIRPDLSSPPVAGIDSNGVPYGSLAVPGPQGPPGPPGQGGWSPDILSEAKPVMGTTSFASVKGASIANNATYTLLNLNNQTPGGYVSSLFLTLQAGDINSVMTIVADGNTVFSDRACLFFGAEYQSTLSSFVSRYISATNNAGGFVGFQSYIPIPFTNSISITFTNKTGNTVNFWYTISYQVNLPNTWPRTQKLVCKSGTLTGLSQGQVATLVNDANLNPGRLLGISFSMDAAPGNASPTYGPLEGEFKFYLDGATSPNYQSSGTEDYIGFAFDFGGFPISAWNQSLNAIAGSIGTYAGLTVNRTNTWNAFRFHIMDPVTFQNAIKVTWDAGEPGITNWSGTARFSYCLWYYTT